MMYLGEAIGANPKSFLGTAGIGDRVAADRQAVAVHHQERAGAVVRAVEGVGEAEIERAVILAVRIER